MKEYCNFVNKPENGFIKRISRLIIAFLHAFIVIIITGCCGKIPAKKISPFISYDDYNNQACVRYFESKLEEDVSAESTWFLKYTDKYNDFLNYYDEDIVKNRGDHYYLLNPGFEPLFNPISRHYRDYYVYINPIEEGSFVIEEEIQIFDQGFAQEEYNYETGIVPVTAWLRYFAIAVDKTIKEDQFFLEFSTDSSGLSDVLKNWSYANIYIEKTCIGTCYFRKSDALTIEWFENYFRKNLYLR